MKIFLSAVSGQFKATRDALASDLRAVGADVVVQEEFQQHGRTLLEKLEEYIASCDRVIALLGNAYGWEPEEAARPPGRPRRSYSQWEYHFARGERLEGEAQPAIDLYVYFATPQFLAKHPTEQDAEAAQRQESFLAEVRASGKDWNEFSSLHELRAVVLRDGFQLQSGDRQEALKHIGTVYNIEPASGEKPRLTAILKNRFRKLLEQRHELFGGREAELERLDRFVEGQTGGYLFVTGPSGFGKTALLANWVNRLIRRKQDVCYHFISRRDQTAAADSTLRNLCQQLTSYHELTGELPADSDQLSVLYASLLSLPLKPERRLVVVLDGLDEATDWSAGSDLFPHSLPGGVVLVFSAKEIGERDWLAELELTDSGVETLGLERFGPEEIVHLLRAAGDEARPWADDDTFVDTMVRKSGGDPFYASYLTRDIQDGLIRSRADLERQPTGLKEYLNRWWEEVGRVKGDEAVRDLVGYLLVAKDRLSRADLTDMSDADSLDDWGFDETIRLAERFIVGNSAEGYALVHPRFKEYVAEEKIKATAQAPYRRRLLSYCERWQDHRSAYAFGYYASHLVEEGRFEDLHELVATGDESIAWASARLESEGSYAGYLRDLRLSWAAAIESEADPIPFLLRYAAIESTVRTLSANVPSTLLARLVPDIWRPAQALARIRQVPTESERSKALMEIAPKLPKEDLNIAFSLARELSDPNIRADTIIRLAAHLPEELLDDVLLELYDIEKVSSRVLKVSRVIRHLSPELQSRALDLVVGSPSTPQRSLALCQAADHLPVELQESVISTVLAIEDERLRATTLGCLARRLPAPLNQVAYSEIYEIPDRLNRLRATHSLARHLPEGLRVEMMHRSLRDEVLSNGGLEKLKVMLETGFLPEGEVKQTLSQLVDRLERVLAAFAWERSDKERESVIGYMEAVAPVIDQALQAFPEETRAKLVEGAEGIAALTWHTALALLGQLDSLAEHLHADVVGRARSIEDPEARVRGVANVARYLGDALDQEVVDDALEAANKIVDPDRRADALRGLGDNLPDQFRAAALGNEELLGDEPRDPQDSASILRRIAQRLPNETKEQVLAAAEELEGGREPDEAFARLAEDLPQAWLNAMRSGFRLPSSAAIPELSLEYVEFAAATEPKVVEPLLSATHAFRNLGSLDEDKRQVEMAMGALVDYLPPETRARVVKAAFEATQIIGDVSAQAGAFVVLTRQAEDANQAAAVRQAVARVRAIENRDFHRDYEKNLLELLHQVRGDQLPDVLTVLETEPDPWIRARVLLYTTGHLLASRQETVADILCGVTDNVLALALTALATLDNVQKPRVLERIAQVADERERARMLSEFAFSLPDELREKAIREAIDIARGLDEKDRGWSLKELAVRLPGESRPAVLAVAQAMEDPALRADTLAHVATYLPKHERTEVLGEVLPLLPEVPDAWRRVKIIEELARELPEALREEALAAAREIPDEICRSEALCRLAHGWPVDEQGALYDEAVATVRQIQDERARAGATVKIIPNLPAERRASTAEQARETLKEAAPPVGGPEDEERSWRLRCLIGLVRYLDEPLAGAAANEAVNLLQGVPERERQYAADDLRRALDDRKRGDSKDVAGPRPLPESGQLHTIRQRELQAGLLLNRMHQQPERPGIGQIREARAAIQSAGFTRKSGHLRQLVRTQPRELDPEVAEELLDAARTERDRYLFHELAEHMTGTEQSRVLCAALTADQYQPGKQIFQEMATRWQEKGFDAETGRTLVPSALAELASRTRPNLLKDLTALTPLLRELFGPQAVSEWSQALRDVTRWWP